ncbi:ylmG homolog protein 2, chloroplastic [Ipomoea triloba]|uniref:ylmG homolog protein 2, chloroplastic n=1 Tax=Ipomoea triloba TaxID=35885 RepID=UPI00125E1BAE|nr:ylmG homolog protein 2, chloroplastic [Ipomoea triloba]
MNSHCSSDEPLQERQKPVHSNCLISLPFYSPPLFHPSFFRHHSKPNLQLLRMAEDSSRAVRRFHSSVVSAADNCLKSLHSLLSQNPFFKKLLSLSSHLQDIRQFQIERRARQNFNTLSSHNFAAIIPGDSVAGIVVTNGILNFLNIYNSLLVVRLVLTWFPNAPPAIVSPLSTLCDPYLNIFRGIIPPLGGTLDLSPILAFLVLNAFTSTAAALPAELPPPTGVSRDDPPHTVEPHLTTSQRKWMRRRSAGNRPKTAGGDK